MTPRDIDTAMAIVPINTHQDTNTLNADRLPVAPHDNP